MKKLYLVDDDHEQCRLITRAFQEVAPEMTVHVLNSGEELLEKLQSRFMYPELILLDFQMHTKNGIEVLKELKEDVDFQDIPVIMFSGSARPSDVSECYRLKAASFIRKPNDYDELANVVETICYLMNSEFTDKRRKLQKSLSGKERRLT